MAKQAKANTDGGARNGHGADDDPIVFAVAEQPALDDLKKQVDSANGVYRQRLKTVAERGISPRALSWFRALRAMPDAKRLDTWRDLEELVKESGLGEQIEMFDDENRRIRHLEPVV